MIETLRECDECHGSGLAGAQVGGTCGRCYGAGQIARPESAYEKQDRMIGILTEIRDLLRGHGRG